MRANYKKGAPAPESHFRQLYEEAPLPYQSLDDQGRVLDVNQAWIEAFGYSHEEALGRFMVEFLVPGQQVALNQAFDAFLERGSVADVAFEFRCKDGTDKLMSINGHIARDDHGRFLRTHCILTDITTQRVMEEALKESEEKYRLAMEATQDGLWDWEVTSGIVCYSPGWGRILSEKRIPSKYSMWEDRLHPDDKPRILKTLQTHLAGKTAAWNEEHRLRNADGTWTWVLGRGQVVTRDPQGNPLRMVGTMTDIHKRKLTEEALHRSEQRLKALINATTDDVVVLLDSDLRIEIANKRAVMNLGKPVDQIIGCTLEQIISPSIAKQRSDYAKRVIATGQSVRFEDHRAGRWYDNNMCPVPDADGNVRAVAIFARDITERKKIEKALAEAKQTTEAANTAKTRFLAAASHDLRQPLQAITAYADLLVVSNTDPALASPIGQLREATLAMRDILEGLLDVSKLEAGAITPDVRAFSIRTLLGALHDQYQSVAIKKGLLLKLMHSSAVVHSDPALLRVILQNLISNAIKYTEKGKILVGCRRHGDVLRIEVWDTGIGIPEDMQESVFEEFFQLNKLSRDRDIGFGIGLAIVKRLCDLLNHPIYMHSVVGRGSCIGIQVPLASRSSAATQAVHAESAKPVTDTARGSILLIEDDEIVLHANNALLTTLGYKVIDTCDAESAMQSLGSESKTPDIIITDYRLPGGCAGIELIQNLRAKSGRLIPAIVLTGDITIPDDSRDLPERTLLVRKPAHVDELVQAINRLLGAQGRD
jgi:two-component system, sensor histidine kinase